MKNKYKIALIPVVLLAIYLIFFRSSSTIGDTIVLHTKTFTQKLSVSGTVEASQTADLGFAQSGRISGVYAKVGDSVKKGSILANIENGDLQALLIQKQANLEKEQANLATKVQGTRPEQLSLTTQKYNDTVTAYITALHNSYLKVESAFLTKADIVFNNGNTVNPTLKINAGSWNEEKTIEAERLAITEKLGSWKKALETLDSSNPPSDSLIKLQKVTIETLDASKVLINDLSRITGRLNTAFGDSQTTIDTYRSTVNDAGLEVVAASQAFDSAQSSLNNNQKSLSLEQAGSTQYDLNAQTAIVKAAEADVMSAESQLSKTIVKAPFDGVVTKMDAKIGEIASSNTSGISMIENGLYLVKSNVPEVYISNLKVGNTASTTLDAYGPNVFFPLTVIAIDPAQTVINGVSNYKTTLQFSPVDKIIRPGMTANVVITTNEIPNSLVLPQGSVFTKDNKKYVQVKSGNSVSDQEVTVGDSSIGEIVITSGLKDGDSVLLSPKVN